MAKYGISKFVDDTHPGWAWPVGSIVMPKKGKNKGRRATIVGVDDTKVIIELDDEPGKHVSLTYNNIGEISVKTPTFYESDFAIFYSKMFRSNLSVAVWDGAKSVWPLKYHFQGIALGLTVFQFAGNFVSFNLPYVTSGPLRSIKDSVLHELAHVFCGMGAGHGPQWKAMCKKIGAKPQACASFEDGEVSGARTEKEFFAICTKCGWSTYEGSTYNWRCAECKAKIFSYEVNKYGSAAFEKGSVALSVSDSNLILNDWVKIKTYVSENNVSFHIKNIKFFDEMVQKFVSSSKLSEVAERSGVIDTFKANLVKSYKKVGGSNEYREDEQLLSLIESAVRTLTGKSVSVKRKPAKAKPVTSDAKFVYACWKCGSTIIGLGRRSRNQYCRECDSPLSMSSARPVYWMESARTGMKNVKNVKRLYELALRSMQSEGETYSFSSSGGKGYTSLNATDAALTKLTTLYNSNVGQYRGFYAQWVTQLVPGYGILGIKASKGESFGDLSAEEVKELVSIVQDLIS